MKRLVGDLEVRQLTLRGFDRETERRIRDLARSEGISLNRAALRFLREGAGTGETGRRRDVVGSSLDSLIGTWSAREAREFDGAVGRFETIDEELW